MTEENEKQRVSCKPIPKKLSFLAWLSKTVFGGHFSCSYCGKWYTKCHSKEVDIFMPVGQNGRCCPDGHEGYTKKMILWGGQMKCKFDYVKNS